MSKQLTEKLDRLFELLISGLEKGGEIAGKELPGLLDEFVTYFLIQDIPLGAIVGFIGLLSAAIISTKLFYKHRAWIIESHAEPLIVFVVLFWGLLLIPVGTFLDQGKNIISGLYAPKAYLIQKLRDR